MNKITEEKFMEIMNRHDSDDYDIYNLLDGVEDDDKNYGLNLQFDTIEKCVEVSGTIPQEIIKELMKYDSSHLKHPQYDTNNPYDRNIKVYSAEALGFLIGIAKQYKYNYLMEPGKAGKKHPKEAFDIVVKSYPNLVFDHSKDDSMKNILLGKDTDFSIQFLEENNPLIVEEEIPIHSIIVKEGKIPIHFYEELYKIRHEYPGIVTPGKDDLQAPKDVLKSTAETDVQIFASLVSTDNEGRRKETQARKEKILLEKHDSCYVDQILFLSPHALNEFLIALEKHYEKRAAQVVLNPN